MKLVINICCGNFGLSRKAAEVLRDLGHEPAIEEFEERAAVLAKYTPSSNNYDPCGLMEVSWLSDVPRNDLEVIRVVEQLGEEANARFSDLKVVEIPDDVEWEIVEHEGKEHVAEKHRTWR